MSGVPAAADQLRKSQAGRHRLAPTSGPRAGTWQPPSCVEFWDVVSPGSLAAARRSSAQSASLREVVLLKFFFFFHFANKFSFKVVYLRLPGGRLKSGDVEPSTRALLGCRTRAPCGHPRPRARLQVSGSVWDDEPGGRKSSWWDVAGRKAPPRGSAFPCREPACIHPAPSLLFRSAGSGATCQAERWRERVPAAAPSSGHRRGPVRPALPPSQRGFALLEDPNQLLRGLRECGREQSSLQAGRK